MNIQHLEMGFPYILIDDFYTEIEISLIWEELLFLCYPHKLKRSSIENGGAFSNGRLLKHTNSEYIDNFYLHREYSNILTVNRKIFDYFDDIFDKHDSWFYKNQSFNQDFTQVSYYENGDEYEAHKDNSMVTCLSWFYKEPKRFEGGNLFFPENNLEIEVLNNRMVIFPSHIYHSVSKIKIDSLYRNKKYGRFCISQFLQNVMNQNSTS